MGEPPGPGERTGPGEPTGSGEPAGPRESAGPGLRERLMEQCARLPSGSGAYQIFVLGVSRNQ